MIGNNAWRTRAHNRRVILEAVRRHGPVSRPELARHTRLTAQAVTNIAAGLLAEGLLLEAGRRRVGRGQPPRELIVNPKGGHTVGVEIAAQGLHMALVDLGGEVLATASAEVAEATPQHVIPLLKRRVAQLRRPYRRAPSPALLGIGVVMPGPFGPNRLSLGGSTELPGWGQVDAGTALEAALGMPVAIENDATAAAVGEHLHGAARMLQTFCLLHIGVGLGLGLFLGGRPFTGAHGNAGELGHVVVEPGGKPCFCGKHGCLERYVSMDALGEYLGIGPGPARREATQPERLTQRLKAGDVQLAGWIAMAARRLQGAITMLSSLFDPEAVLLGGIAPETMLDRILAEMGAPAIYPGGSTVPLLRGTTGKLTPALGAAALPLLRSIAV